MNFSYVVGRFYFKHKKICFYAGFPSADEAKKYVEWKNVDISLNSVLFIYNSETQETVFRSDKLHASGEEKWRDFKHTVAFDCDQDTEINLIDLMWKEDFDALLQTTLRGDMK